MARSKPIDLDDPCHCPMCGWMGRIRDAIVEPDACVECPGCRVNVEVGTGRVIDLGTLTPEKAMFRHNLPPTVQAAADRRHADMGEGQRTGEQPSTDDIAAACAFRDQTPPDGYLGPWPWWHGWAIAQAYLAGLKAGRANLATFSEQLDLQTAARERSERQHLERIKELEAELAAR